MGYIQEKYRPQVMAANSTYVSKSTGLGGFICTVSGSMTITSVAGPSGVTVPMLTAMPVTAGIYYPLVMLTPSNNNGATVTLSGGAAGTLLMD